MVFISKYVMKELIQFRKDSGRVCHRSLCKTVPMSTIAITNGKLNEDRKYDSM